MATKASTARTRGSYAKTEELRREVLDAALRLVAETGFDVTTLQDVADSVGRSKAGVLHHFGSLDNLMLEILKHRDGVNRQTFPTREGAEYDALLELVAHNATVPGLIGLFSVVVALAATDTTQTTRRDYFTQLYTRNRSAWTERTERAQQAGRLRTDLEPDVIATLIIASLDGLQIQWLLDSGVDMIAHLRALNQLLAPVN